jgi:hypothetical protein
MKLENKICDMYKEREISNMCAEQYHTILTKFQKEEPEVKQLFDKYLHDSKNNESLIYLECLKYSIDSKRFDFLSEEIKQAYFNIAQAYERRLLDIIIGRSR